MENTFRLLETKDPSYSLEEKAKIVTGLLYVIKQQLSSEINSDKLLLNMTNCFLDAKIEPGKGTLKDKFRETESIDAFYNFLESSNVIKAIDSPTMNMPQKIRNTIYTETDNKLAREQNVESKIAADRPKSGFGSFMRSRFNLNTQFKQKTKDKITAFLTKIQDLPSIDSRNEFKSLEEKFVNSQLKYYLENPSLEKLKNFQYMDVARSKFPDLTASQLSLLTHPQFAHVLQLRSTYEKMQKDPTTQFSVNDIDADVMKLNVDIKKNIAELNRLSSLTNDRPLSNDEQQATYACIRKIDMDVEALQWLAKIAELKLNASGNLRRGVTDTQAQSLQGTFSSVNILFDDLKKVREEAVTKLSTKPEASSRMSIQT